ncbi:hypothetical protein CRG98_035920 [Punica granatum]|uniref:Retroviral polymerase SH3-like domain-containing protein n=1 Tax=Punica granatum TaxID=22663 RepID=A0A2I0II52_PUNGR|nr:hypothetical protein CRG98_035920 [Punica granatum]
MIRVDQWPLPAAAAAGRSAAAPGRAAAAPGRAAAAPGRYWLLLLLLLGTASCCCCCWPLLLLLLATAAAAAVLLRLEWLRLIGPNFSDWLRNLNIVLNMEAPGYILENQEIELPGGDATSDQHDAYDQCSVDDTKLNGVSERRNRTLLDMVRSMMSHTDLPILMWGYALQTTCYLLNRIPSKSVSTTPYEIWNGRTPSLKHFKIWGCPAFIKKQKTDKLETRSEKGRFVGYPSDSLGYYFYFPTEQRVVISRDAIFLEKQLVQEGGMERQIVLDEASSVPQTDQMPISMDIDKPVETPIQIENVTEPRRSGRVTHTPARYLNLHENVQELFVHGDNDHRDDPTTYEEAISDIDSSKWLEAVKSEMDSMSKNQVWDLVDPPKGIVPIGNKWIFNRKIGADGKVWLSNIFSMKDLGEATYILGIWIYKDRPKRLIGLSQALYLDKVLKRFNMQDSKRGLLPVRHGIHLSKAMSPKTPEERKDGTGALCFGYR